MGSIIGCYNLNKWKIEEECKYTQGKYAGQDAVNVIVGYADYDYEGFSEWNIIIPKIWYDGLISGTYKLVSNKLNERTIVDNFGNELFTYGAYLDEYIAR